MIPNGPLELKLKKETLETFAIKSTRIHGDTYEYKSLRHDGKRRLVTVVCKKHGEFEQDAATLLKGGGCPLCAIISRKVDMEGFIQKLVDLFPDYDFSEARGAWTRTIDKVPVICPEHGRFMAAPHQMAKGKGCRKCGMRKSIKSRTITLDEFLLRAKATHGDRYDYSATILDGFMKPSIIICREHGEFRQSPQAHTTGQGCPVCANNDRIARNKLGIIDFDSFVERARATHGDTYTYFQEGYAGVNADVSMECKQHGAFEQRGADHLDGSRCPVCARTISLGQKELYEFIKNLCPDAEDNYSYGVGRKQVDIFIPSLMLAVEFDGIYFHSTAFKTPSAHLKKRKELESRGISLIRIFEDEWEFKKGPVKQLLTARMGKSPASVYARNCEIYIPSQKEMQQFHNKYHVQGFKGYGESAALKTADGEVVAVMTFSRRMAHRGNKVDPSVRELVRFSTSVRVIGGASKLMKVLCGRTGATKVISYSDNRLFSGGMYRSLGFERAYSTLPSYTYAVKGKTKRMHKSHFRRSELPHRLGDMYDPSLSERKNCERAGYYRVYDCGLTKWIYTAPSPPNKTPL